MNGLVVRVAAIDLGRVRVGLAVSDELGMLAHPRPHLSGADPKRVLDALARLARDEGIERFLVGLPTQLDGREGSSARRARRFADALERQAGVPVSLVDERLTTVEAQRRLRQSGLGQKQSRQRIDSAAAAVMLQSYLDAGGQGSP